MTQQSGFRIAANPIQRPASPRTCQSFFERVWSILTKGTASSKRGLRERIRHLNEDLRKLYEHWAARGRPDLWRSNPPTDSWEGHLQVVAEMLDELRKALEDWDGTGCPCTVKRPGGTATMSLHECLDLVEEAKSYVRLDLGGFVPARHRVEQSGEVPEWLLALGITVVIGAVLVVYCSNPVGWVVALATGLAAALGGTMEMVPG